MNARLGPVCICHVFITATVGELRLWWLISTTSAAKKQLSNQAFLEADINCVRGIYGAEFGNDVANFPIDGVPVQAKANGDFHLRIAPGVPTKDLKLPLR